MLYLVRYKDGFIIGADGDSPAGALAKAEAATARKFDDVDAITERASTFVVYDSTRGWLSPKDSERAGGELVDANTGDVVGVVTAKAEPPLGIDLDPPTDPPAEVVLDPDA